MAHLWNLWKHAHDFQGGKQQFVVIQCSTSIPVIHCIFRRGIWILRPHIFICENHARSRREQKTNVYVPGIYPSIFRPTRFDLHQFRPSGGVCISAAPQDWGSVEKRRRAVQFLELKPERMRSDWQSAHQYHMADPVKFYSFAEIRPICWVGRYLGRIHLVISPRK